VVIRQGDVWWAELPGPAGHRPVVILSRNEACEVRRYLTVAPVTTRVRDIPTEVALGAEDGMSRACVVNLDSIATVARNRLTRRVATLHPAKIAEVNRALKFALGVS
jgi:mRNA interferase MazF